LEHRYGPIEKARSPITGNQMTFRANCKPRSFERAKNVIQKIAAVKRKKGKNKPLPGGRDLQKAKTFSESPTDISKGAPH